MPKQPRRKATIADAMLLIIGVGLAFSAWRGIMWMPMWRGVPESFQLYHFRALAMVAFLIPLSLSLLAIVLRPPRPRFRRLASEPAVVVGLSAFFVLVIDTALLLMLMGLVGWSMSTFTGGKVIYYCRLLAEQTGMAISTTWLIQAVSGRCRRPRSWIDISAWVLGAWWIILAVASVVFTLL
jgi:hypothetical protein